MEEKTISDKEWLDLAWKHFQQHAQQRILYFNYFVIFSTILTTGIVSTFQSNFQAPYLGIGLGVIQMFLSYIFKKIDDRNSFLTKHGENVIKNIERDYELNGKKSYQLFLGEENETQKVQKSEINKCFLNRQFTHSKSYRIIFITFFFIGLIGGCISLKCLLTTQYKHPQDFEEILKINLNKIDTLSNEVATQDSIIKATFMKIQIIEVSIDSNTKMISKQPKHKKK